MMVCEILVAFLIISQESLFEACAVPLPESCFMFSSHHNIPGVIKMCLFLSSNIEFLFCSGLLLLPFRLNAFLESLSGISMWTTLCSRKATTCSH